jgi:signal peptidase II
VLAWNTGISYGLFQQTGPLGQWALLALKVIVVALLLTWLAGPPRLAGLALGLSGAIGT